MKECDTMPNVTIIEPEEMIGCFKESLAENDNLCLYIDLPFCRSNCLYCIYHSLPYKELLEHREEYANAVFEQLDLFKEIMQMKPLKSVYFGGGTPSLWTEQELSEIISRIPGYDSIESVKSEMHPYDLDDRRIEFYAEKLHLKIASLGVQSLDADACKGQRRLYVSPDKLKHIVDEFHKYGIYVNIDLVALFNGDTEKEWHIFENDIHTVTEYIKPDVITSVPNYRTKLDYISQLPRFRIILASVCSDIYVPSHPKILSLDEEDIKQYGKNDHWIGTKEFFDFIRKNFRYCCSPPAKGNLNDQATIAIGGAGEHYVYSYTKDGRTFYSAYDFDEKAFVYYRCDD